VKVLLSYTSSERSTKVHSTLMGGDGAIAWHDRGPER